MTKIIGFVKPYALSIQKKLGKPGDEAIWPYAGIYQMRTCKEGRIPIRMKFYAPSNIPSDLQNTYKTKFGDGVRAWQALTDEQKAVYNSRARWLKMYGFNLYLKEYMLA